MGTGLVFGIAPSKHTCSYLIRNIDTTLEQFCNEGSQRMF